MLFLQSVTKHADKLKQNAESKVQKEPFLLQQYNYMCELEFVIVDLVSIPHRQYIIKKRLPWYSMESKSDGKSRNKLLAWGRLTKNQISIFFFCLYFRLQARMVVYF